MERIETSVAEALSRAHAVLLEDLRKLETAVHPETGESVAGLRAQLNATRTHIAEHFRFEEQNGYMNTVRRREPRLEHEIQQLAEEHRRLMQSLEGLIVQANTATGLDNTFQGEVRGWIEHVRQHEARENDLVQNAFNLDISAED
jgi:hypothetical protein